MKTSWKPRKHFSENFVVYMALILVLIFNRALVLVISFVKLSDLYPIFVPIAACHEFSSLIFFRIFTYKQRKSSMRAIADS